MKQQRARWAAVRAATGGREVLKESAVQRVWAGYGEVSRCTLAGAAAPTVIVKHVAPPPASGRSHRRKLRSYEVEAQFYRAYAADCDAGCRVATCHAATRSRDGWIFVFEDLDAAGFAQRASASSAPAVSAVLEWLACFHATFLGRAPSGLWRSGTYWHLQTRPDELTAMPAGPLRAAASAIDEKLSSARFQTLVHGDAKPANFCFSSDCCVAAVDFQYVGGGCGIKDVAYLLTGQRAAAVERGLNVYFAALRAALGHKAVDCDALEHEWRALFPWAWADFHRFMVGWAPGWRPLPHESARTKRVLQLL